MKPTIRRSALMRAGIALSMLFAALPQRLAYGSRERGDVPGWVMITLMSAVLVMGLLAVAGPALEGLFNQAINRVSR
ncbi:hypothetical protein [Sinomonas atrocyanea]